MQPSGHVEASTRLLSAMLAERESVPRAALLAQQAAEMVSDGAAVVYMLDSGDPPGDRGCGRAGDRARDMAGCSGHISASADDIGQEAVT